MDHGVRCALSETRRSETPEEAVTVLGSGGAADRRGEDPQSPAGGEIWIVLVSDAGWSLRAWTLSCRQVTKPNQDGTCRHMFIPKRSGHGKSSFSKKGAGYKRTSSVLGIKPSVVRDWARRWRNGLFTAEIPRNLYRYDDETMKRVSALYRNGCRDIGRLSEQTGVPSGVCQRIVARCEREETVTKS